MLVSFPEVENKKTTGKRFTIETELPIEKVRCICHNEIREDYSGRQARLDIEEACEHGANMANGKPECTYNFELKLHGRGWDTIRGGDLF